MEPSNEIVFEVMVMYIEVLKREIDDYNTRHNTNFEIIEVIDDEVIFCKIKVTNYKYSDLYNLGYSVSVLQYTLRERGEIDW